MKKGRSTCVIFSSVPAVVQCPFFDDSVPESGCQRSQTEGSSFFSPSFWVPNGECSAWTCAAWGRTGFHTSVVTRGRWRAVAVFSLEKGVKEGIKRFRSCPVPRLPDAPGKTQNIQKPSKKHSPTSSSCLSCCVAKGQAYL